MLQSEYYLQNKVIDFKAFHLPSLIFRVEIMGIENHNFIDNNNNKNAVKMFFPITQLF